MLGSTHPSRPRAHRLGTRGHANNSSSMVAILLYLLRQSHDLHANLQASLMSHAVGALGGSDHTSAEQWEWRGLFAISAFNQIILHLCLIFSLCLKWNRDIAPYYANHMWKQPCNSWLTHICVSLWLTLSLLISKILGREASSLYSVQHCYRQWGPPFVGACWVTHTFQLILGP